MNQNQYEINRIFDSTDCISQEMLLKYSNQELTDAQNHIVERHMVDCPFCSDAIEGIKLAGSDVFLEMVTETQTRLEKRLSGEEAETDEGKVIEFRPETQQAPAASAQPRRSSGRFQFMSIAASVLLLAVVSFFFFRGSDNPANIADEMFTPFAGWKSRLPERVNPTATSTDKMYAEAKKLYDDGNFAEAAPLLDKVDSIMATYCAASCYYQLGDMDKAAARFRSLIAKDNGFHDGSEFGLAMVYLKQDKVDDARSLLQNIAATDGHNYERNAEKALKRLKGLE